jgi:hypothetical protein
MGTRRCAEAGEGPVGQAIRYRWHRFRRTGRRLAEEPRTHLRRMALTAMLWTRARLNRRRYRSLSEPELRGRRRSDTVFVFGSGYSLNDISEAGWKHIAAHDVFGFSGFIYQRWVRTDFHLVREWGNDPGGWHVAAQCYAEDLESNPHFEDTVLLLQGDYVGLFCHILVARGLLREGRRVYWWKTARRVDDLPSRTLRRGVTHCAGMLFDAVNFAYLLGWRRIVLAGVDLYDSRYFWAPADATLVFNGSGRMVPAARGFRGQTWAEPHNTVRNGVVGTMARWAQLLRAEGVELSVYNPRSLLRDAMPVFEGPGAQAGKRT